MTPSAPLPMPGAAPWLEEWRRGFARHGGRTLAQAATVAASGAPEVRTVVLRGLSADGCPYFAADLRSGKVRAIRAGSYVELCVWWADSGVQTRLRGPAAVVDGDRGAWGPVRERLWHALGETERRGFSGPSPGSPLDRDDERPPLSDMPHPNYGIVVVTPLRFDRLELGEPHDRKSYRWDADAGWHGGRVAP